MLHHLDTEIASCCLCPLHQSRTNTVPGDGNPASGLLLVGEAPGANEDAQGIPFVGAAGKLLDRLLSKADTHGRKQYYITNILKCRPPGNRDPRDDEIQACTPFLQRQIEVIQPKVIVAIGRFAACYLSLQYGPMGAVMTKRDLCYRMTNIPVIPIYHPSYLLRQGQGKTPKAKKLFQDTVDRLQQAHNIVHSR